MELKDRILGLVRWKEFKQSNKEVWEVYRWINRELTSDVIRYWTKRMFWLMTISCLMRALEAWPAGLLLSGILSSNLLIVLCGLLAIFVLSNLQHLTGKAYSGAREFLLGLHIGKLDHELTRMIFEKSVGQHRQESSSLSIKNIDKGRGRVMQIQETVLFQGITVLLELALSWFLVCLISPGVAFILAIALAGNVLWMMRMNHTITEACEPFEKNFRALNRHRLGRWEKIDRVKTNAKTDEELTYMAGEFDRFIAEDRAFWLWFIKHCTIRNILTGFVYLIGVSWGIWLVWRGELTAPWFVALFGSSTKFVSNLWQVGSIDNQIKKNIPSVQAMIKALSIPPDVNEKENPVALDRDDDLEIRFENVSYTYPAGKEDLEQSPEVLRNISLVIESGEKVALIGPSGAGKTTVMHLLLRHMDPTEGKITIANCDLRDLRLRTWLEQIGYIPQGNQIFDGTIRYNLLYSLPPENRDGFTDEDLWDLMKELEIDFGGRLTKGLDTVVGDNGIKLSGGQSQRLMIGAAVIGNPRFLVIDEATSSLDSTTERKVQAGLQKILTPEVGALIIAHRLSTVRNVCSRFVVLRDLDGLKPGESQIEAIGTSFEELYELSPTFRQLADDQELTINRPELLSL